MCVAENTLRGVSVELSAISGQQRRRTQRSFLEKAAKPLFRQSPDTGRALTLPVSVFILFEHAAVGKRDAVAVEVY